MKLLISIAVVYIALTTNAFAADYVAPQTVCVSTEMDTNVKAIYAVEASLNKKIVEIARGRKAIATAPSLSSFKASTGVTFTNILTSCVTLNFQE